MEILYYTRTHNILTPNPAIRWLSAEEYEIFREHLELCGQRACVEAKWRAAYSEGATYCGLFVAGQMVARACVERYSVNAWELADVRTAKPYRGNGYASQVCAFALAHILAQGRTATIRTEEDNAAMRQVIKKLGFTEL